MVEECSCWTFFANSNVGHSRKIIVLALWTNFARFSGIHRKFAQRTFNLCRQPWQMRKISWIWSVARGFARGLLVSANATDLAPKATVRMLHYNQTHFSPSFPCRTRLAFMNHHFSSLVQKCTGWTGATWANQKLPGPTQQTHRRHGAGFGRSCSGGCP